MNEHCTVLSGVAHCTPLQLRIVYSGVWGGDGHMAHSRKQVSLLSLLLPRSSSSLLLLFSSPAPHSTDRTRPVPVAQQPLHHSQLHTYLTNNHKHTHSKKSLNKHAMSDDSGINAAILNYLAKATPVAVAAAGAAARGEGGAVAVAAANGVVDDGAVTATTAAAPFTMPDRETEDYDWLRAAMSSVESPEKKLKKMLFLVDGYRKECFEANDAVTAALAPPPAAAAPAKTNTFTTTATTTNKTQQAAAAAADTTDDAAKQSKKKDDAAPPVFANAEKKNEYFLATLEELADMVEDINWACEYTLMTGPARTLTFIDRICTFVAQELARCGAAAGLSGPGGVATTTTTSKAVPATTATITTTTTTAALEGFTLILPEALSLLCLIAAHASQLNDMVQAEFLKARWPATLIRVLSLELEKEALVARMEAAAGKTTTAKKNDDGDGTGVDALPEYLRPSSQVIAAALHACSCLCRDFEANTIAFIHEGGIDALVRLLRFSLDDTTTTTTATKGRASSECQRRFLTSKIIGRIFFFASYLADCGLSAEELIELICRRTELPAASVNNANNGADDDDDGAKQQQQQPTSSSSSPTTNGGGDGGYETTYDESAPAPPPLDGVAERAAADALLSLATKSAKVVSQKARAFMPRRLREWETAVSDEADPRRRLIDVLNKAV